MPDSGVTHGDIDTGLDRPLTQAEQDRLERWISDAETLIGLRNTSGATLNPEVLAMVVRMAVEYRWEQRSQSGGASTVTVSVDDGAVTRRYDNTSTRGSSAWWFLPEWWEWLMPDSESGAFSTRPGFEPDTPPVEAWA